MRRDPEPAWHHWVALYSRQYPRTGLYIALALVIILVVAAL